MQLEIPTMRSLDADKASSKSKNGTDSAQAAPVVEEKIDFSKVQIIYSYHSCWVLKCK